MLKKKTHKIKFYIYTFLYLRGLFAYLLVPEKEEAGSGYCSRSRVSKSGCP